MINRDEKEKLARAALKAREASYSPYSGFSVGAALLTKGGKIYEGANIENSAYSPSNCAERTVFFKAVSEGQREFLAIAVAGGRNDAPDDFCYPCGVCRQVMMEFVKPEEFVVIIAKSSAEYREHTLSELLPYGFGPEDLK